MANVVHPIMYSDFCNPYKYQPILVEFNLREMSDFMQKFYASQLALGCTYVNGILTSPAIVAQQAQQDFIQDLSQSRRRRPVDRVPQHARDGPVLQAGHVLQGGPGQQAGPGQQDGLVRRFRCPCKRRDCYQAILDADQSASRSTGFSFKIVRDKVAAGGDMS